MADGSIVIDETATKTVIRNIGLIGLGGIGAQICRRLAGRRAELGLEKILGFDLDGEMVDRLADVGVIRSASVAHLVDAVDLVMLCLPSGAEVGKIARRHEGLLDSVRQGQIVLDLGTSPVALTRQLAAAFAAKGVVFMDSPVTQCGVADTSLPLAERLSTVIGGETGPVQIALPVLRGFSKEITHVGAVGSGQVIKQMDDLVRLQTVAAFAEALSTARAAGVDGDKALDALSKGASNGSALQHLGALALLRGEPPEGSMSVADAKTHLSYAIELAEGLKLDLAGARNTLTLLDKTIDDDLGDPDLTSILKAMDPKEKPTATSSRPATNRRSSAR